MVKMPESIVTRSALSATESIIKKIFGLVGMEIRWTPTIIDDPIRFNTDGVYDIFFSDRKAIKKYISHARLLFYEEVVSILINNDIPIDGKKIADIGCGTGHLLKILSEQTTNSDLHGFDHSDSAIHVSRNTVPEAVFHTADIYKLDADSFDVVLCTEVLEHLMYPVAALHSLIKSVRETGTLVITVPDGRIDVYRGHINFWSPESWNVFIKTSLPPELECSVGVMSDGVINYAIIRRRDQT